MNDEQSTVRPPVGVLRGLHLHETPHELPVRRKRPEAGRVLPPSEPDRSPVQEAFDAGYRRGLAEGAAAIQQELDALAATIDTERRKGFEAGRAEGEHRGMIEAAQALEKTRSELAARAAEERQGDIARVQQILGELSGLSGRIRSDAENDLVALAHELVCRILRDDARDPAVLRRMAASLLADREPEGNYALHVHPDDLALIQAPGGESGRAWRWVGDESVVLGGVVARSEHGSIDARLETQLRMLGEELLVLRRAGAPAVGGISP